MIHYTAYFIVRVVWLIQSFDFAGDKLFVFAKMFILVLSLVVEGHQDFVQVVLL